MFIQIDTIDSCGVSRNFFCSINDLEQGIELVEHIVLGGGQIQKAELIENDRRTTLPPEILDWESYITAILNLESQWQQVLRKPVNLHSVHRQLLTTLAYKCLTTNESRVVKLKAAIEATEHNILSAQNGSYSELIQSRIVSRLEKLLEMYQKQLTQALSGRERIAGRLNK